MKNSKLRSLALGLAVAAGLALSTAQSQAALTLDFSAMPNSVIQFSGHSFGFVAPGQDQWLITSETGGTAAVGLEGWVDNGPWTFGDITVDGIVQSAPVTGGGTLHIPTNGDELTGDVQWMQIMTVKSFGGINADLAINLSNLQYSGTNPDLLALVAAGAGNMNVSFQFSPGKTLTELAGKGGPFSTSFSGSISAVPEPTTVLAGALLLLPFGLSAVRTLRKRNA